MLLSNIFVMMISIDNGYWWTKLVIETSLIKDEQEITMEFRTESILLDIGYGSNNLLYGCENNTKTIHQIKLPIHDNNRRAGCPTPLLSAPQSPTILTRRKFRSSNQEPLRATNRRFTAAKESRHANEVCTSHSAHR